jgi:hypothetical protein
LEGEKMMKTFRIALCATTVIAATSLVSAQAKTFYFNYTSKHSSGSGVVDATSLGGGEYLATSATGTIDGSPLTLIAPGGFDHNDNIVFFPPSPVFLDFQGIAYAAGGGDYNLFFDISGIEGPPGYYDVDIVYGRVIDGRIETLEPLITGEVRAIPEPSTWAMTLLGFAGLGYAGYRRRRSAVAVTQ